jgi:hypothetical protein
MRQTATKHAQAHPEIVTGGSALLVILIAVGLIAVMSLRKTSIPRAAAIAAASTNPAVAAEITSVPAAVLNKVAFGPAGPTAVAPLKPVSGPPLALGGKPEVLYIGAEPCPLCAAERWALTEALSRFGTFSNLHFIHSSTTEAYAGTPTLTFYQSSYTSKYLTFRPVELETVSALPLQAANAVESGLLEQYAGGALPFVDVGGKYILDGTQYKPSTFGTVGAAGVVTKSALTWSEVGSNLRNPNSQVALEILGAANHITAAICQVTNDRPSTVCKSPSVTSIGKDI